MTLIDENAAEQACLEWFEELGYTRAFGPDLASRRVLSQTQRLDGGPPQLSRAD